MRLSGHLKQTLRLIRDTPAVLAALSCLAGYVWITLMHIVDENNTLDPRLFPALRNG